MATGLFKGYVFSGCARSQLTYAISSGATARSWARFRAPWKSGCCYVPCVPCTWSVTPQPVNLPPPPDGVVMQRVPRQAETATALALWFSQILANAPDRGQTFDGVEGGVVSKVWHASLQGLDGQGGTFRPLGGTVGSETGTASQKPQMTGGPPTFAIMLTKPVYAKYLPSSVKLFVVRAFVQRGDTSLGMLTQIAKQAATSLGGVESLVVFYRFLVAFPKRHVF
jgi:hypothetical protein